MVAEDNGHGVGSEMGTLDRCKEEEANFVRTGGKEVDIPGICMVAIWASQFGGVVEAFTAAEVHA